MITRERVRRRPSPGENAEHGVTMIAVVLLVGVGVLSGGVMLSAGSKPAAGAIGAGVTMFLLFTASGAIGAALGFLFGLPRARFTDELSGGAASTGATGGCRSRRGTRAPTTWPTPISSRSRTGSPRSSSGSAW